MPMKFKKIKSLKLIASMDRELGFENYGQLVRYVWFRFNPRKGKVQLTCALGAFVNEPFKCVYIYIDITLWEIEKVIKKKFSSSFSFSPKVSKNISLTSS